MGKKQKKLKNMTGALLLSVLILTEILVPALAAREDQTIQSFAGGSPVYTETVGQGTEKKDLELPDSLKAELEGGGTAQVPVTWEGGYDGNTPGTYTLTAEFSGYTYAQAHPYAVITVEEKAETAETTEAAGAEAEEEAAGTEEASAEPDTGGSARSNIHPNLDKGDAYLEKFEVIKVVDGTADFDTSTDPDSIYYKDAVGNDENDSNGIVRSFDNITYDIEYQTKGYSPEDVYESGGLNFEFLLPLPAEQAQWDTEAMSWMDIGKWEVRTEERTYDFDGDGDPETLSCQVLRGSKWLVKTLTNPTAIPGSGTLQAVINVLAAPNGTEVHPVFTGWMDFNLADETELSDESITPTGNTVPCSHHNRIEQVTAQPEAATRVTAAPRYNVQILQGGEQYTSIASYDFDEGNDLALDKGNGIVTGKATTYGVTLQLYNHAGRGLKGVEYPSGPITFDLELSTRFVPTAENPALTDEQQAQILKDYTPLVLSWGAQETAVRDGRDLGEMGNMTYAVGAAPGNSGMRESQVGVGSTSCYNGGTWKAEKTGTTISVTVSDYAIQYPLFPNGNMGNAGNDARYFNPADGVQNIGCFSGGKFFIVTPFYNNGTTDVSKKGTHILDEYGLTDGNFITTIKGVKLRATSVTGQALEEAEDNSNQERLTDDSVSANVYLSYPGGFEYRVAWSQLGAYTNFSFFDVLKRPQTDAYNWALNGQDVLTRGSDVAIGSGFHYNENSDSRNRLYAADVLCKFDGSAVTLTGQTSIGSWQAASGWEAHILYATKPDGSNWTDDNEMNQAELEDLCYYVSLDEVPEGHTVVAYLTELRPKGNDPSNIKKYYQGARIMVQAGAKVNMDDSLVDNVYQMVIGGKFWSANEYNACDGDIPSLLGNDPSAPTQLPAPTITDYRTYEKAYYDDSGYAGGHTGDYRYGDSLLVVDSLPAITKRVEQQEDGGDKQIFQLDTDQRYVDYALTPSFPGMPEGVYAYTTLTITDTLGKGLSYVPGTSYLGGAYIQDERPGQMGAVEGGEPLEPEVRKEGDTTVLTWVLPNVRTDEELPVIHFSAVIGTLGIENTDVQHNDTLNNTATIRSTGDLRDFNESNGNLSSVNIRVSKLLSTSLSKVPKAQWYDPGDAMEFTLNVGNTGANGYRDAVIVDTLPYNGDSRGSSFHGDFAVQEIQIVTDHVGNEEDWRCYYTTSEAAKETISSDYTADDIRAGTSVVEAGTVEWTEAAIDGQYYVPELEDTTPTAIAWIGDLNAGETFRVNATFQAPDARAGDIFVNGLSRGDDHTIARVYTAERGLSGVPWLDANEDGHRDNGEALLEGVRVQLLEKDALGNYAPVTDTYSGEPVYVETRQGDTDQETEFVIESRNNLGSYVDVTVTAIARGDGSYEFDGLPAGEYGVRFESGSSALGKYIASPTDQGSDYTDSDGVPRYSDGGAVSTAANQLEQTEIRDIRLPTAGEMASAYYISRYHDSGFYYKQGSVTIQKNGEDGQGLAGVVFRLEKKNSEGEWEEVTAEDNTTDGEGRLKYEGLYPGEYRLTEAATVEGNSLLTEPVMITIPYSSETAEGTPSYSEGGQDYYLDLTYTIENGRVTVLPSAGDTRTAWYIIMGGGTAIAAALALMAGSARYRRRQRLNRLRWSLTGHPRP